MSAKSIAKQLKSKGLQRLRWYCQLCEKQCRDENGFKCHCSSPAHLRQLEVFAQNQRSVLDKFSEQFKLAFLSELSLNYRNSRVSVNKVYNDYIANKQHVHMNATRWTTLTEFIQSIAAEGICMVEETDKGLFVTYAPETKLSHSSMNKRAAEEDVIGRKENKVIKLQVKHAERVLQNQTTHVAASNATLADGYFSMDLCRTEKKLGISDETSMKHKSHMVGTIMRTPSLSGGCVKAKYLVLDIHDGMAKVQPLGIGKEVQISSNKLLTVIPAAGGKVKVLKGVYAGLIGTVISVDIHAQILSAALVGSGHTLQTVKKFMFHEVSKLFANSSTE